MIVVNIIFSDEGHNGPNSTVNSLHAIFLSCLIIFGMTHICTYNYVCAIYRLFQSTATIKQIIHVARMAIRTLHME